MNPTIAPPLIFLLLEKCCKLKTFFRRMGSDGLVTVFMTVQ